MTLLDERGDALLARMHPDGQVAFMNLLFALEKTLPAECLSPPVPEHSRPYAVRGEEELCALYDLVRDRPHEEPYQVYGGSLYLQVQTSRLVFRGSASAVRQYRALYEQSQYGRLLGEGERPENYGVEFVQAWGFERPHQLVRLVREQA